MAYVDTFDGSIYLFPAFHNKAYRVVAEANERARDRPPPPPPTNPMAISAIKILFSCVRVRADLSRDCTVTFARHF